MATQREHYEKWKNVLPRFTEEQERKLFFMMDDYARDEVKKFSSNLTVIGSLPTKSTFCDEPYNDVPLGYNSDEMDF